jgi:ATP/maltotriose-dependent transcriptional regulator MalT
VKTHVARLYEKLEVKRRTEAIVKARELGMLR